MNTDVYLVFVDFQQSKTKIKIELRELIRKSKYKIYLSTYRDNQIDDSLFVQTK